MRDSGPVFPTNSTYTPSVSLLDWYAGHILAGMYASGDWNNDPAAFSKSAVEEAFAVSLRAMKERACCIAAMQEAPNDEA